MPTLFLPIRRLLQIFKKSCTSPTAWTNLCFVITGSQHLVVVTCSVISTAAGSVKLLSQQGITGSSDWVQPPPCSAPGGSGLILEESTGLGLFPGCGADKPTLLWGLLLCSGAAWTWVVKVDCRTRYDVLPWSLQLCKCNQEEER